MPPQFNFTIDTAEQRIARDRIVTLVDGRHWDDVKSTAYVEGITHTAMLMPLPKTPEWQTTTSGVYSRLHKADYTFDLPPFVSEGTPPPYPDGAPGSPDKWVEFNYFPGDVFMQGNGVNDRVITNARYPKNRPFYLAWFAYNEGKTSQVQIEFGWISEVGFIGVAVWTDGKTQIYKNGFQVGQGNIFERKVTSQTVYGKERLSQNVHPKARRGDAKQLSQQLVDLLIIPCRRRDLFLQSNQGGGFKFTFADLDPDDPDNEITPKNSRFFWRVPIGQATVQCAPLNFLTSGILYSDPKTLSAPPNSDESPVVTAYVDQPGYGSGSYNVSLVDPDDLTTFVPNGTKDRVRVKVSLTGDGTASNWIYGASAVYDAITAETNSAHSTDLTGFVQQASLSVPDNPADMVFKVTLNAPAAMETAGAYGIRKVENRPVECSFFDNRLSASPISFLTGRTKSPSSVIGVSDEVSHVMLEMRDRCKAMEEYRFKIATPYDGLELAEAMTQIVTLPGHSRDDIDIPDFGFNLPTIGTSSEGEFALYPEVGDKAIDWFTRLYQTYARHCEWGWIPTAQGPRFRVASLDDLNFAGSVYTLYATIQDAIEIGGISQDAARFFVYRTSEPTSIPCEANDIYVTGRDPNTAAIFNVRLTDTASIDPTIIPLLRPDNWVGEPREYAWADTSIVNLETASWVAAVLQRRLTQPREIYAFTCEFMLSDDGSPVWRGDVVTLWGIGDVRITSLSAQFQKPGDGFQWNPTHYTSELVRYPTL